MEKRPRGAPLSRFCPLRSLPQRYSTLTRNARRSLMTERSERMSEEASFHLLLHISRSLCCCISRLPHEALS